MHGAFVPCRRPCLANRAITLQVTEMLVHLLALFPDWPALAPAMAPVTAACWRNVSLAASTASAEAAFQQTVTKLSQVARKVAQGLDGECSPAATYAAMAQTHGQPAAATSLLALMAVTACSGACSERAASLAAALSSAMAQLPSEQAARKALQRGFAAACAVAEQCSCRQEALAALMESRQPAAHWPRLMDSIHAPVSMADVLPCTTGWTTEVALVHNLQALARTCCRICTTSCLALEAKSPQIQLRLQQSGHEGYALLAAATTEGWQAILQVAAGAISGMGAERQLPKNVVSLHVGNGCPVDAASSMQIRRMWLQDKQPCFATLLSRASSTE